MGSIKKKLLKNKFIWKINATIKSISVVGNYNFWKVYYNFKKPKEVSFTNILGNSRPNVIYVGTDEKQDKSGFFQALKKNCNLVIPFTTKDGKWGQYDSDIADCSIKNLQRLEELLQSTTDKIDAVIMQSWGFSFDCEGVNELKKKYSFKVMNIDMDSRLVFRKLFYKGKQNPGIFGLHKCVDLMLVTTREIVDWYIKEGVPAIYFPLASSPEFYYPIDCEKIYDVGFIGQNYGIRQEVVEYLKKSGINVEARGNGWEHGPIEYTKNNLFFNRCRILLGIGNIAYCKNFFNPKLRDYDAPMSGAVYITNWTKELEHDFVDGEEIILIKSMDEMVKKIKWLLDSDEKMNLIRKRAHAKALSSHTYEQQINELFLRLSRENNC